MNRRDRGPTIKHKITNDIVETGIKTKGNLNQQTVELIRDQSYNPIGNRQHDVHNDDNYNNNNNNQKDNSNHKNSFLWRSKVQKYR